MDELDLRPVENQFLDFRIASDKRKQTDGDIKRLRSGKGSGRVEGGSFRNRNAIGTDGEREEMQAEVTYCHLAVELLLELGLYSRPIFVDITSKNAHGNRNREQYNDRSDDNITNPHFDMC